MFSTDSFSMQSKQFRWLWSVDSIRNLILNCLEIWERLFDFFRLFVFCWKLQIKFNYISSLLGSFLIQFWCMSMMALDLRVISLSSTSQFSNSLPLGRFDDELLWFRMPPLPFLYVFILPREHKKHFHRAYSTFIHIMSIGHSKMSALITSPRWIPPAIVTNMEWRWRRRQRMKMHSNLSMSILVIIQKQPEGKYSWHCMSASHLHHQILYMSEHYPHPLLHTKATFIHRKCHPGHSLNG